MANYANNSQVDPKNNPELYWGRDTGKIFITVLKIDTDRLVILLSKRMG